MSNEARELAYLSGLYPNAAGALSSTGVGGEIMLVVMREVHAAAPTMPDYTDLAQVAQHLPESSIIHDLIKAS